MKWLSSKGADANDTGSRSVDLWCRCIVNRWRQRAADLVTNSQGAPALAGRSQDRLVARTLQGSHGDLPQRADGSRPLSHTATVTPQTAEMVAHELNEWIYSAGGLCAEATTRGAVLGLRDCCRKWAEDGGAQPNDLYTWRNLTTTFLRRDLDLGGLDSYDFDLGSTLLSKLQDELDSSRRRRRGNRRRPS